MYTVQLYEIKEITVGLKHCCVFHFTGLTAPQGKTGKMTKENTCQGKHKKILKKEILVWALSVHQILNSM